jgi:hypothetical protein
MNYTLRLNQFKLFWQRIDEMAEVAGVKKVLCPWYPDLQWRYLDDKQIAGIEGLLDLQEEILHGSCRAGPDCRCRE